MLLFNFAFPSPSQSRSTVPIAALTTAAAAAAANGTMKRLGVGICDKMLCFCCLVSLYREPLLPDFLPFCRARCFTTAASATATATAMQTFGIYEPPRPAPAPAPATPVETTTPSPGPATAPAAAAAVATTTTTSLPLAAAEASATVTPFTPTEPTDARAGGVERVGEGEGEVLISPSKKQAILSGGVEEGGATALPANNGQQRESDL